MAITHVANLFTSTSTTNSLQRNLGASIDRGSLIVLAARAFKSSTNMSISSVTDSRGNTWGKRGMVTTVGGFWLAWSRIGQAMDTNDWIKITWNTTPTYQWCTAEAYEGGAGTAFDDETAFNHNASSTASVTLNVDGIGGEYLVACLVGLPYDFGVATTPLNTMTERRTHGGSSPVPGNGQAEYLDRNTSGGTSFQAGQSLSPNVSWDCVGAVFAFEELPVGGRSQTFLIGV